MQDANVVSKVSTTSEFTCKTSSLPERTVWILDREEDVTLNWEHKDEIVTGAQIQELRIALTVL
jgi:hypothetical protein